MPNSNKARAPQNTTVTISMEASLKARIEAAAKADWMRIQMEEILDRLEQEQSAAAAKPKRDVYPPIKVVREKSVAQKAKSSKKG